jgi:hypothetical protein
MLAKFARRLFVAKPMPDLQVPGRPSKPARPIALPMAASPLSGK